MSSPLRVQAAKYKERIAALQASLADLREKQRTLSASASLSLHGMNGHASVFSTDRQGGSASGLNPGAEHFMPQRI
jgi:hypothetical protein